MSAKILEDYDAEVRKVLSCFEPSAPVDLNREVQKESRVQSGVHQLSF